MENKELTVNKDSSAFTEMPSLHIREMQITDLNKVSELEKSIFPVPWSRNNILYEIVKNLHSFPIVMVLENEIIGYAIYWCFDTEAHLGNFAIDSRCRRRNLGSLLLEYVVSDIIRKNAHDIYLEVRESNHAARNLYLKHGFKEVGVRKNYYLHDKEDAILMSLSLKEG